MRTASFPLQWLAWAFYSKDYSETYAVERREISEYVGMITDKLAIEENESVLYNELIRDSDRSITNHNIPIQSTTTTPTNDVNNGACGEASPISMPTTTATLTVEAGYNPEAPAPFRFNIEPVPAQYRPLVYYGFSHLLFGK